jgi:hypothetical protein
MTLILLVNPEAASIPGTTTQGRQKLSADGSALSMLAPHFADTTGHIQYLSPKHRLSVMILNRLSKSIRKQDWFAVLIEFIVVVAGIFAGLQANEWAQELAPGRSTTIPFPVSSQ